jgi:hypothetical protein
MIHVSINEADIRRLELALKDKARRLPRHIATVCNQTAKKVRIAVSREIGKEFTAPIGIVKKIIKVKNSSPAYQLSAKIGLGKGYPFPLKYLRARQGKRGVTFKPYKSKPTFIRYDAFVAKNWGGHVYKRLPGLKKVAKLYGPSPGDFYESRNIKALAERIVREEFPKQLERRIKKLMEGYIK